MKKIFTKTYYAKCPYCNETIEFHQTLLGKMKTDKNNLCPNCNKPIQLIHDRILLVMEIIIAMLFLFITENKILSLCVILIVYLVITLNKKIKQGMIKYKYYKVIKK